AASRPSPQIAPPLCTVEKAAVHLRIVARVHQDRIETELHEATEQPVAAPTVRLTSRARLAAREPHLDHLPVARVGEWQDDRPDGRKALLPQRVLYDDRHDLPPSRARRQPGGILGHHTEEVGDDEGEGPR